MSLYLDGFGPDGGAAYTPLVKGADPAAQNLTAGTTAAAAVTFAEPTGGSGVFTYGGALAFSSGSGGSLSGSGLGPWTASSLADADILGIVLTATDAGAVGQAVTMRAPISVAPAAVGPGWYVVHDWDFTGLDTLDMSADGSHTVQKSGVDFFTFEVDETSNPGTPTVIAGADGITLSVVDGSSNGTKTIAGDITDVLAAGASGVAADYLEPIALQYLIAGVTISGGTSRVATGWSDQLTQPHNSSPAMMAKVQYDGVGTVDLGVREYDGSAVSTIMEAGATSSTTYLMTVRLDRGNAAGVDIIPGATAYSDPPDDSWYGGHDVVAAAATYPVVYATPHMGIAAIRIGSTTMAFRLVGARLIRYGVAP